MRYVFGDFVLDDDVFELSKRGARIALRRQALDVLLHLVRARDRVVTKGELLAAVWAGAKVSETSLPQAITAVRRALEDDAVEPQIVQTVRARGYRFALPVSESASASSLAVHARASTFVGRDDVMAQMHGLLAAARAAKGSVALIVGSTGAGKTRVVAELAVAARAEGARIFTARCQETGAPDLWPWIQILRACAADDESRRADIDGMLREIVPHAGGDAAGGRIRFFDFATQTLVAHASSHDAPLVVAIDDLHWADASALLLFKLAAQAFTNARIVLVATYRDAAMSTNHVLARTLGALTREDPRRSIHLTPLERDDVAALARAVFEREPEADIVDRVLAKSDGNALFVTQLLHVMRSEAWMVPLAEGATSALLEPEEVREALALHLDELSAECRLVLSAAAALGATFPIAALAPMVGREPADVLAALDQAIRAKVVAKVEVRTSPPTLRFVHELVRDLLYKQLGSAARMKLHEAAARVLAEMGHHEDSRAHIAKAKALVGDV